MKIKDKSEKIKVKDNELISREMLRIYFCLVTFVFYLKVILFDIISWQEGR